jgi:dCTP deaminase
VGFKGRIGYGKTHTTLRMILPDREIKKLLAKKLIVIDPTPTADAYSSTSVDLTLDPLLRVFRAVGAGEIIDPSMPGYKVRTLLDGVTDPVTIPAQGSAPTIHAGFTGTIQLEMINHGPMHIKLRPGMAICQLILETTKGMPDKAYKGQFSGQRAK